MHATSIIVILLELVLVPHIYNIYMHV